MDDAALEGFRNGAFEDSQEDTSAIVEEFFPTIEDQSSPAKPQAQRAAPARPSLPQKPESQATRQNSGDSAQ